MHDTPGSGARPPENRDFDVVDQASVESFPASDAPGWATGQLAGEKSEEAVSPAASEPGDCRGDKRGAEPAKRGRRGPRE